MISLRFLSRLSSKVTFRTSTCFVSCVAKRLKFPQNKFVELSCPFPLTITHWPESEYMSEDFDKDFGTVKVFCDQSDDPIAFVDHSEGADVVRVKILEIPHDWLTGRAEIHLPVDLDVSVQMTQRAPISLSELQLRSLELDIGKTEIEASEDIQIKHIEGDLIQLHSRTGELIVGSLYSKITNLSTIKGNIVIGSCHGNTKISTDVGYVQIDGMDGPLKIRARKADCDVFAPKVDLTVITLEEEGNIYLGLPKTLEGTRITSVVGGVTKVHEFTTEPDRDSGLMERKDSSDSKILLSTAAGKVKIAHEEYGDRASGKIGRGIGRSGFPLIIRPKQLRLFD